ncbi:helix-turn-helix domain-containing protein [Candidatus Stoquefichus sp. SB1]|uniref:helix-turn-helix domain-containing protein n=1 Tax=Candidatus Stoquefichus sp. SB1 TaxID=1658109 RepID=UPI00067EDC2C|nr:helix-turn-helix transcriptional regulator [Candidatus Stoquefichus sp. SB1]
MNELNLGKNIVYYRRKNKLTQDQLAEYIGVSKSSVSKWENNFTFPDITLLPQLAALFNISVDELMGYSPQLTKERIESLYKNLAVEMGQNPMSAYEHSQQLIKQYYSCFEFLYYMSVLYVNHYMLFENKDDIANDALSLCKRIENESHQPSLIKDAISLELTILLVLQKPYDILDTLGETARPISQDSEMIAAAFQMLGNVEKANEIYQSNIYQHLLMTIQDSISLLNVNMDKREYCEEILNRVFQIMDIFHIEQLHFNISAVVYLNAAIFYTTYKNIEQALTMIEKYTHLLLTTDLHSLNLHGDDFFKDIDHWLNDLMLGTHAPRGPQLIKESVINALSHPALTKLQNEKRFQICLNQLKNIKED